MTDDGRYRFLTIRPGRYPWGNHHGAWRPAHIDFSVVGNAHATGLFTQMHFPADDRLPFDPVFNSTPGADGRKRLIARFERANNVPDFAHPFESDNVLRGRGAFRPSEPCYGVPSSSAAMRRSANA
jgi:protocatechuate 3,4-dioxygenase, beta subunit